MQIKANIQFLQGLIGEITDKNAEEIVGILGNKVNVNEYKISNKLEVTINQVRNILYRLYDQNIVSFIRKKDKLKGWYIYFWTLNIDKAFERVLEVKEKILESLQHQLESRETKNFFLCAPCNIEFNEETALTYNFICPECGQLLKLTQKTKIVAKIKTEIENIKKKIALIKQELIKIEEKFRKAIIKESEKQKKEVKKKVVKKGAVKKKAVTKKEVKKKVVKKKAVPKKAVKKPMKKKVVKKGAVKKKAVTKKEVKKK